MTVCNHIWGCSFSCFILDLIHLLPQERITQEGCAGSGSRQADGSLEVTQLYSQRIRICCHPTGCYLSSGNSTGDALFLRALYATPGLWIEQPTPGKMLGMIPTISAYMFSCSFREKKLLNYWNLMYKIMFHRSGLIAVFYLHIFCSVFLRVLHIPSPFLCVGMHTQGSRCSHV